jgi:imidazolonepropionase-like amidohydrolase
MTFKGACHREGVVLNVGSDSLNPFVVPGAALQEELGNFVECGSTLEQAWEAATRGNGESLPENGLGVLAAGAPADLLVLREDPTRDLSALASLQAVVASGRLYPREVLEVAVARYRDHHAGWLQDRLSMLVVSFFAGSAEP